MVKSSRMSIHPEVIFSFARRCYLALATFGLGLLLAGALAAPAAADDSGVHVRVSAEALDVLGLEEHGGGSLVVSGPDGLRFESSFGARDGVSIPLFRDGDPLPDGTYRWELRARPASQTVLVEGEAQRVGERGAIVRGVFQVRESLVAAQGDAAALDALSESSTGFLVESARVLNNDRVIIGWLCTGEDCTSGEVMGTDVLRLKEETLRLRFDDTSTGPSPANDWRLIINDEQENGANYFALEDATGATIPWQVDAGAPTSSMLIDSSGQVGLGTSTPGADLHLVTDGDPTLRLEQDTTAGATAQTWELSADETALTLRDVTNSSSEPFQVHTGNGSDVLVVKDDQVGVGTDAPDQLLHVKGDSGVAQILVEEDSFVGGNRVLLQLANAGGNVQTEFLPVDGAVGTWRQSYRNTSVDTVWIPSVGSATTLSSMDTNGNLSVLGTVFANGVLLTSDRKAKRDFEPVDSADLLQRIVELPMSTWSFKRDSEGTRHIGPMAQDFHAAFGVGADDLTISPQDTASVALVGVQALKSELEERDERIHALEAANAALLERLEALEAKLAE